MTHALTSRQKIIEHVQPTFTQSPPNNKAIQKLPPLRVVPSFFSALHVCISHDRQTFPPVSPHTTSSPTLLDPQPCISPRHPTSWTLHKATLPQLRFGPATCRLQLPWRPRLLPAGHAQRLLLKHGLSPCYDYRRLPGHCVFELSLRSNVTSNGPRTSSTTRAWARSLRKVRSSEFIQQMHGRVKNCANGTSLLHLPQAACRRRILRRILL